MRIVAVALVSSIQTGLAAAHVVVARRAYAVAAAAAVARLTRIRIVIAMIGVVVVVVVVVVEPLTA